MRKHFLTPVLFALSALLFVACNQSGGGSSSSNSNQYAATPQPCNSANMATSNCQTYTGYYPNNPGQYNWSYGAWMWPTQYQVQVGSCGCPAGYFPVQSPYYGTACAPNAYRSNFGGVIFYSYGSWGNYWNYSQNGGWMNRPQAHYQAPGNSCSNSTAQGCDVRVNSCPSGSRCQPVAGGSTIGLCIR